MFGRIASFLEVEGHEIDRDEYCLYGGGIGCRFLAFPTDCPFVLPGERRSFILDSSRCD
jgi:hypothetical protein